MLLLVATIVGCSTTQVPTPTQMPTPTPATAQERVNVYDKYVRWEVSLLLRYVEETEQYRDSKPMAFESALRVFTGFLGLQRLPLPSKSDFEAIGDSSPYKSGFDPKAAHAFLLGVLAPCQKLGAIAMDLEGETSKSLLDANAACKKELLHLKDDAPRLFDCPVELGLCPEN